MIESDILSLVIEKYLDPSINLSPNPINDSDGNMILLGLDNHSMGTVFEELIRKFNEENNEEAGEHFTPRDVIKLMANLIFKPIADKIESGTYLVYDGACGTGGMLTVAEATLKELGAYHNKEVAIHLYGQESQPETYAISKADLLIKGEGSEAENFKFGSTLSSDAFPEKEFDFMLSNPPYGKSWKNDLDRMGGKNGLNDQRFVVQYSGNPEYKMIPRSSDGQMLFLVNKISKMKRNTLLGSRIAEVHNGSSLFTGDAGQGESNIRRWIIENDWLEAIIALPENMFYNTGIATYIWIISNRKPENRKGMVQLIDASGWYTPLRKNLGKKNCEFSAEQIKNICDQFISFQENEKSKIFPNQAFGYYKITVERPLRLKVELEDAELRKFQNTCNALEDEALFNLIDGFVKSEGIKLYSDWNLFISQLKKYSEKGNIKLSPKRLKIIQSDLAIVDEKAEPVIKAVHKKDNKPVNSLYGKYEIETGGIKEIVEYEPDSNLRDTEQVPLLEEGGIDEFFKREVLSYVPDAWIDETKTQIGYEISFTRYFYKPVQMRSLEDIVKDIKALEAETQGLLEEIIDR
jgi:type I restriction enzyme M protein